MLISLYQAAKRLGMGKQTMLSTAQVEKNRPDWVVQQNDGSFKVNDEHKEFKRLENKFIKLGEHEENKTLKRGRPKGATRNKKKTEPKIRIKKDKEIDPETLTGLARMRYDVQVSELKKKLLIAEKEQEGLEQEKIKTALMKKELIPIDLMKHFFSFGESLIQSIYARCNEISPELSSLYLSKKDNESIILMKKEFEAIFIDTKKMLIEDLKKEGLNKSEDNK